MSSSQTAGFAASLTTFTITGNAGVGGATMALAGTSTASVVASPSGDFSFGGLPAGGSYLVTPSLTHYNFIPPNAQFANLSSDQTAAFVAAIDLFDITGNVGVAGATITLTGSTIASTTSDAIGNYFFSQLPAGGSYTITPSRAGYGFAPVRVVIGSLESSRTIDFVANASAYSITGNVGVGGAAVSLSGGQSATINADASGNYAFANLPALGSYTVTPSLTNYTFTPTRRTVVSLTADSTMNFLASTGPGGVTVGLSHTSLNFGATSNSAFYTSGQDIVLGLGSASTDNWSVSADHSWLQVSPASGVGKGKFRVSLVPQALPLAGTYTATVNVSIPSISPVPLAVNCTLTVVGTPKVPAGFIDTPVSGTTGVAGSLPVTGWALDDIEVAGVSIWRDPQAGEPASGNGYIFIGNAVMVANARPDVESAYPTTPLNYRAGWGYMLLTNTLPGGGNSTFRLHAIATSIDGLTKYLGSTQFTAANSTSQLPFGSIATPAQGGTVSGAAYVNTGWALTPPPAQIPVNGSTINVFIDGAFVGHPVYNQYRADIAALFPTYLNSAGAGATATIDTTQFADGTHTISWGVIDNAGHRAGIGSRYFVVQNGISGASLRLAAPADADRRAPAYRRGYGQDTPFTVLESLAGDGDDSVLRAIEATELERIELCLPATVEGVSWQLRRVRPDGSSAPLPPGSSFDGESGMFTWQLAPGVLGRYRLEFSTSDGAARLTLPVTVLPAASTSVDTREDK